LALVEIHLDLRRALGAPSLRAWQRSRYRALSLDTWRALEAGAVLFALGWGSASFPWPMPAATPIVVALLTALLVRATRIAARNAAASCAPTPPRADAIDESAPSAAIAFAERADEAPAPAVAEVEGNAGPSGAPAAAPEPTREPARRVLLVEDDELVREAVTCLFEADGFCVEAVGSADHAVEELARLEAEGRRPDLLVTDHRLPGTLTGAALVDMVRAAKSPLPAILMSGDVDTLFLDHDPPPGVAVLRKPVSGSVLLAAVAKVLGSPASGR
jgi:CheY-like chemotaxis protein